MLEAVFKTRIDNFSKIECNSRIYYIKLSCVKAIHVQTLAAIGGSGSKNLIVMYIPRILFVVTMHAMKSKMLDIRVAKLSTSHPRRQQILTLKYNC